MFGEKDSSYVLSTAESLRRGHIAHQVFNGEEANQRYSHQLNIPVTSVCVLEEDGGILHAKRALQTVQVHKELIGIPLLSPSPSNLPTFILLSTHEHIALSSCM